MELVPDAPFVDHAPVLFRRYIPGKGSPLWHPEAEEFRFTEVPIGPRTEGESEEILKPAFLLQGSGVKSLSIKDPFDPSQFQRVEVEATVFEQGIEHFQVEVVRLGEVLLTSPILELGDRDRAPTTLVFDFPALNTLKGHFDELRIRMLGPAILSTISMVSLLRTEVQAGFPEQDPKTGVCYATWGGETRRGWVLGSETTLRMDCAQSMEQMRLSYAPLPAFHNPELPGQLRIAVDASVSSVAMEWNLPGLNAALPTWHDLALEWSAPRGQRSWTIEFLRDARSSPLILVADPAIYPKEGSPQSVLLVTSEGMHWALTSVPKVVELPTAVRAWLEHGVQFPGVSPSSTGRTPELVALMTGRLGRDTGIVAESDKLSLAADTLAERFHRGGYRTIASVYSQALGHDASGLGQGFDRFASPPEGRWSTSQTIQPLREWLNQAPHCPTFLWLHLPGPKSGDPASPPWGTELEALLAHPALDDAMLAFTATVSDQTGATQAVAGSRRIPLVLHQRGLRVELPGEPRIAAEDLGRTLLELMGLPATDFPGRNMTMGPYESWDQAPQFTLGPAAESLALQGGPWLMVVHTGSARPGSAPRHFQELYRLDEDPECKKNLASSSRAQARRLRLGLCRWAEELEDLKWNDPKRVVAGSRAWIQPQAFRPAVPPPLEWLPMRCACSQCPPDLQGE